MDPPHFIWSFLPFWAVVYGFAVLAWTCLGRFALQAFFPPDHPNYIWRGFRLLTDVWIRLVRGITPAYVTPVFLPLLGALWAFLLRFVIAAAMFAAGLAPRLSEMQGG